MKPERTLLPPLFVSMALALPAFADGLLKNADFSQTAPDDPKAPAAWQLTEAHRTVYQWADDDGHSESHSLRYVGKAGAAVSAIVQEVKCQPNTEYALTAAMKSDGKTRPVVQVVAPGDKPLRVVRLESEGETVWTVFSARFNSGATEAMQVQVFGDRGIESTGKAVEGSSAIDDVQVYLAAEVPEQAKPRDLFTPPGPNLAKGKSYTLGARPNYGYCTDPDDATQLTDGVYSLGYFWVQKTTVGWSHATPLPITLDLGEVQPIAGVSYSTAAGVAGVAWPTNIAIFVSDDGEAWTHIGDLARLGTKKTAPPADKYSQFRFTTDELKARGRYVQLVVDASPYIFVDEIEVYRGPDELLARAPEGEVITDLKTYFTEARVFSGILWRLRTDLNAARKAIEAAEMDDGEKKALLAKAEELSKQVEALPQVVPDDFRAVLPFSDLHARIYALNAPVLLSQGLPSLSVWQTNRWDPLQPTDAPGPEALTAKPAIELRAMLNEVRGETLNLTNATEQPLSLHLELAGIQSLTVREVLHTDTKDRAPIAAALPKAGKSNGAYQVSVPAGCTRQIWLSFEPDGTTPSEQKGALRVAGEGIDETIPLALKAYPVTMPATRSTFIGGWDYTNGSGTYDARPSNLPPLIEALRAHGVNTPWANAGVRPTGGKFDGEGNLTSDLSFTRWDEWVERWPDSKLYCVFMNIRDTLEGQKMGTPRFDRMVGDFFRAWVDHIADQGIDPNKLAVLLFDEPHDPGPVDIIVNWAKAIKAAAPEVVIWEDPTFRNPNEVPPGLFEVCDVICPNLPMFMNFTPEGRKIYTDQRDAGKELWFYSCSGPGKRLDPYNYHRGQFWWALKYSAVGSHYWAFCDEGAGGTSWNPYRQTRTQYSPLFLDEASVTRGKHMEAIREGAQDFEYFVMLRQRIEELEKKGVAGTALAEAKKLLTDGPNRVVAQLDGADLGWQKEFDRSLMDTVRVEVLQVLVKLKEL